MWLLHKYEAHIKGLPICFSEVQVKNDVTDNNNKHFVTAFEGECRNIIELREHLKLCFLIILKKLSQSKLGGGIGRNGIWGVISSNRPCSTQVNKSSNVEMINTDDLIPP